MKIVAARPAGYASLRSGGADEGVRPYIFHIKGVLDVVATAHSPRCGPRLGGLCGQSS